MTEIDYEKAIPYMKERANGVPDFKNGEYVEELYKANIKLLTKIEEMESFLKELPDPEKMESLYTKMIELMQRADMLDNGYNDLNEKITNLSYTINALQHQIRENKNHISNVENVEEEQIESTDVTHEQRISQYILSLGEVEFTSLEIEQKFDMNRQTANYYLRRLENKKAIESRKSDMSKAKLYRVKDRELLARKADPSIKDPAEERLNRLRQMVGR